MSDEERLMAVARRMADTLRAVLAISYMPGRYPWEGGAFRQQIREDLTDFEALSGHVFVAPADTEKEGER